MAKLEDFIAFKAALALHEDHESMNIVDSIYEKCVMQVQNKDKDVINYVKEFYAPFSANQISSKIGELLSPML